MTQQSPVWQPSPARVKRQSPAWLQSSPVKIIFDVFKKNKEPVFAVGGCVRNALMEIPDSGDIDFATPVLPAKVNEMFVAAGYRTEPTGIEHGTVSVIIDHVAYEVTTYRRDVETDGRRAVVEFSTDIRDDAERRDFTFNALYMDAEGYVYEPNAYEGMPEIESGISHARNRKLKFVGSAGERIKEDYLRILRLYRFMAVLGCNVDPNALYACAYYRRGLNGISGERIEKEVMKLLAAESPIPAITEMVNSEVGVFVLGLDANRYDAAAFARLVNNGPRDAALRLAFLLTGGLATPALDHWKSSNELRRRVLEAQIACSSVPTEYGRVGGGRHCLAPTDDDNRVREYMYRNGKQAVLDGAWIIFARGKEGYTVEQIERWSKLDVPVFPLKGQDFLDAGHKPGAMIGEMLRAVEQRWIENGFPDRDWCLKWTETPERTNA